MESAMLRYFSSKAGLCSLKLASDWGLPASTMATFRPASERRFAAQPPEAPEPTTKTSKFVGVSGVGICESGAIVEDRDAVFYEEDANKRGDGRQRKKMDLRSAKVLLDVGGEWYHRRRIWRRRRMQVVEGWAFGAQQCCART